MPIEEAVHQVVQASIERIRAVDPRLRSVLSLAPDAVEVARALESERQEGRVRGPLHGVPVLVKDNIETIGPPPTTAGSTALSSHRPKSDAPTVAALRKAGAVVIGKANLSEWANFRSTRSTSGWSALGGLTRNPYALDRSAGGSSSGSGAAVAGGIVPLALGTETDASILSPAALCGCVGLKPTVGLTSREGVVPISASQDTVGPIARDVRMAAAALDALAGGDHLTALEQGATGLRVGVARRIAWGRHDGLDTACERAVSALAASGVVVEDVALEVPEDLFEDELTVLLYEFHAGIDAYLGERVTDGPQSLEALVDYNRAHPEELAHFGQELFERALETGGLDDPGYLAARDRCRSAGREKGIDAALAAAGLDALAAPTCPPAWKSDFVNGDGSQYSASHLPAVAGYPAITVPVGLVGGLPVGLTFFGTAKSEAVLLRLAAAVESALGPLPPPTFRQPDAG